MRIFTLPFRSVNLLVVTVTEGLPLFRLRGNSGVGLLLPLLLVPLHGSRVHRITQGTAPAVHLLDANCGRHLEVRALPFGYCTTLLQVRENGHDISREDRGVAPERPAVLRESRVRERCIDLCERQVQLLKPAGLPKAPGVYISRYVAQALVAGLDVC